MLSAGYFSVAKGRWIKTIPKLSVTLQILIYSDKSCRIALSQAGQEKRSIDVGGVVLTRRLLLVITEKLTDLLDLRLFIFSSIQILKSLG